jgi:hypothetical protein
MKSLDDTARFKRAGPNQENHIDQIAHPTVRRPCPRQRVCVKLLCELLLTLDHRNGWRRDAREPKPVTHLGLFQWVKYDVADSYVQMELRESAPAHDGLHWVSRSTIRCSVQVRHRLTDAESEEVPSVDGSHILELLEQYGVGPGRGDAHGEIEILGGARGLEPEFHRVAALQDPVLVRRSKKPGKESVEGNLPAKTLQIDPFFAGYPLDAFLKRGAERDA